MDIITQGLLGGAMAQTVAQAPEVRRNMFIGVFAGLAADADVFISSTQDPLLTLEYHRQFTHSLLFIPFGALFVAGILWLILRNKMPFTRIYLVCLLGYCLSGFIDACTSYGTQLLWPLSDQRIAFNIISIVDPLFTGPLLLLLLVWRSLYINDQQIHIDGLRVGFGSSQIYVGDKIARLDMQRDFAGLPGDSIQIDDIERFSRLSNDFVAVHPDKANVVGDMRYSLLPNSSIPLWGIEINEQLPQEHARFITFRNLDALVRQQFLDMLTGNYPGTTIE